MMVTAHRIVDSIELIDDNGNTVVSLTEKEANMLADSLTDLLFLNTAFMQELW